MIDWRGIVAVAAGAAVGGVARYLITTLTVARFGVAQGWWATAFINVSGAFLIGVVAELALRGTVSPVARMFLATGILGGYTTFSTYALEVVVLAEGSAWVAGVYALGSLALGVAAALAGGGLTRLALR